MVSETREQNRVVWIEYIPTLQEGTVLKNKLMDTHLRLIHLLLAFSETPFSSIIPNLILDPNPNSKP